MMSQCAFVSRVAAIEAEAKAQERDRLRAVFASDSAFAARPLLRDHILDLLAEQAFESHPFEPEANKPPWKRPATTIPTDTKGWL